MSVKSGGWADAVLVQSPQEKRPRKSPRKSSPRKFSHTKNATLGKNILKQSPQKTLFPFRMVSGQLQPRKSPQKIRHLGKNPKGKT